MLLTESAGSTQHTAAPQHDPAPAPTEQAPQHHGGLLAKIQAIAHAGEASIQHVASMVHLDHPEWPAVAQWLHQARGNEYVQRVMAHFSGSSAQQQLAALKPDQRKYYDEIRGRDPKMSEQDALKFAQTSRPLDPQDQSAVVSAVSKLASVKPRPINPGNNPNVVQIEVSFDGTWDQKDQMAFDTNPALISDLFEGTKHYEKGVATDPSTKLIGGWFGAGISNRIDEAYNQVVADVNAAKSKNPNAECVLIVAGFSRGSAAARAFVNVLNKRGVPDTSSKKDAEGHFTKKLAGPRIGAMILFDTVGSVGIPGTNLNPGLDLTIPANAENVLHLTAGDEKRLMFPLSSAKDSKRPNDSRITEIALPGSHADVGGSRANDYSRIPLAMADDYLRRAGAHIKPVAMPDVHDPSLRLHDSGGSGPRHVFDSNNPTPEPELVKKPEEDHPHGPH
jgi:hypothetical protein